MKYITSTAGASGEEVQIHYADYGQGTPVVLIHGWPLNMHMWEYQVSALVNAGFRVVNMIGVVLENRINLGMATTTIRLPMICMH